MTPRRRLVALLAVAGVLVAAVVVLRETPPEVDKPSSERVRLAEYAAPYVSVPPRPAPPEAPSSVRSNDSRIQWNAVPGAAGYEVDGKLVAGPETTGTGTPLVRAVDAFGQRSAPTRAETRENDSGAWRGPLSAHLEEFTDPFVERAWHISRYRGCVNPGFATPQRLTFDMTCGRETATLRSRTPFRLNSDEELGRVAVVTDAAGPRGALTIDLVPGTPDLVGPTPPVDAIRVVVDDSMAGQTRAAGVLHRFELVLTRGGTRVLQDGVQISSSAAVPRWREASVLVSVTSPPGRHGRVEIDTIGFSGPAISAPDVSESDAVPGTLRVLEPEEEAPGIGVARAPLVRAGKAKLRATVRLGDGGDLNALVAQLGEARFPVRPVVTGWSGAPDSEVTVEGEVPASLTAPEGPDALSPFVLRMPGASQAQVVESYFELPGVSEQRVGELSPAPGATLPVMTAEFTSVTADQATLLVTFDAATTPVVAPIAGFEVYLDQRQVAVVPMPGGVGGRHELRILLPGSHNVEVRLRPEDPQAQTDSVLLELSRSSR